VGKRREEKGLREGKKGRRVGLLIRVTNVMELTDM